MGRIGSVELIVILLVALLVFGKRLPDVARQAGRALSEFRRSFNNVGNLEVEEEIGNAEAYDAIDEQEHIDIKESQCNINSDNTDSESETGDMK